MIVKEFELIYEQTFRNIFNYIYSLSRDHALAEDITQDTFLKAYECMIAEGKPLNKSWFYTVARNKYISVTRERRFLFFHVRKDSENELFDLLPDGNDTPEEYVLKKERSERIEKVLSQLCESYRTGLILREYHELSLDEIASIIGIKRTYAKQLLYKAREKFKTIYGGKDYE